MAKTMTRYQLPRIRRNFLTTVYIIVFLNVLYIVGACFSLYNNAFNGELNRLNLLADQLKTQTIGYFDGYVTNFQMLARLPALQKKEYETLNPFFKSLNEQFNEFVNVAAVDENGFFFASGRPFDAGAPPNISKLLFFQKTRSGEKSVIMEPHVGPISREPVTGVVVRLEDESHQFKGLLGTSIKLSHLTDKWSRFADIHHIDLVCYREKGDVVFSKGVEKDKLEALLSSPPSSRQIRIGETSYLYATKYLPELSSIIVLLHGNPISIWKDFYSSPLNIAICVFFLLTIAILFAFHRKEVSWLESLIRSESLLRHIIDSSADYIFVKDLQLRTIICNKTFAEAVNKTPEEMIGKTDIENGWNPEFVKGNPEKGISGFEENDRAALNGRTINIWNEQGNVRGEVRNFDTIKLPLRNENGEITGVLGISRDITERKRFEQALNESNERHLALLQTAMDGFWMADIKGHLLEVNETYCRMSGYTADELLSMKASDLDVYETAVPAQRAVAKGEDRFETRHRRKDGSLFDVEVSVQYRPAEGGRFVVFLRDITDRKEIEARLQQAQKMEAIGTLAGGIAHDFNNVLYPLLGYAELLRDELPTDAPQQAYIDEIIRATLRSRDLVKQILTFSHKGDNITKPILLPPILKEALKLLRSSIPKTIDIEHEIDSECGVVKADPIQVHQIIMNLATNAYHAMEDSGGCLKVGLKEIEVAEGSDPAAIRDLDPGKYAVLTVSDTGTGIEPQLLDKIFNPYFTTKGIGKGTGLGLSVVQGIVKTHKGDIRVSSKAGKGTDVEVYLPIMEKASDNNDTDNKTELPHGNERILLVDDEEAIVSLVKRILEKLGYQVEMHSDSIETLEAFRNNPTSYDLVVTDLTMPKMTGDRLAQYLISIRPEIPIIICTGYNEKLDGEKAAALGVKGVITKPIVNTVLAREIRKVLDQI